MTNRLPPEILQDLTQKAYSDAEDAVFRVVSLISSPEDGVQVLLNVGVNLINNTLDQMSSPENKSLSSEKVKLVEQLRNAIGISIKDLHNV